MVPLFSKWLETITTDDPVVQAWLDRTIASQKGIQAGTPEQQAGRAQSHTGMQGYTPLTGEIKGPELAALRQKGSLTNHPDVYFVGLKTSTLDAPAHLRYVFLPAKGKVVRNPNYKAGI